jgi:hypothetical protein
MMIAGEIIAEGDLKGGKKLGRFNFDFPII